MKITTIEDAIEAARLRGEDSDEPGHEVGDLQDMLRNLWELIPEDCRSASLDALRRVVDPDLDNEPGVYLPLIGTAGRHAGPDPKPMRSHRVVMEPVYSRDSVDLRFTDDDNPEFWFNVGIRVDQLEGMLKACRQAPED